MKPATGDERLAPEWVRAWRTDAASAQELRRAYARFRARRDTPSLAPVAGRWLLAGLLLLLGFGMAYGATGAPLRALRSLLPGPSIPAERALEPTKRPARGSPAPARTAAEAATHAVLPAPPPSAASSTEPPVASTALRTDRARGRSGNAVGLATPNEAAEPSGETAARRTDDAWQRVARDLREQNFTSANATLLELEAGPRPADRDAARLTRAQLLLAGGQHDAARELLADLAANAGSARMREKARRLLTDSKKSAPRSRSSLEPPVTN
jgi:hypothetical protein